VADYHQENFFHGDIKPENLFINSSFDMTSDAGTLLFLGVPDENPINKPLYMINQFTKGYASDEHVKAIING
jgi:serine/threonine protein kinase